LVQQRIAALEATIAQKQRWIEQQEAIIREQVERQVRLGGQLHNLRAELARLETQYADRQVAPHSKLAQARQQKETWERQLGAALEQEGRARRALWHHQRHLAALSVERDALLNHLARLEVDNTTNPNPVRMRWLLDGGFGDAANVTYLIEMGYDLYSLPDTFYTTRAEQSGTWNWMGIGSPHLSK
jgi:chromosome segregation ATPase